MAVARAVVDAADATPHDSPLPVVRPHAAPVERPALTADEPVAERIFCAVLGTAGRCLLLTWCFPCVPARQLCLCGVEHITADDSLMMVLDQVHRKLACVLLHPLADGILYIGLLA